MRIFSITLFLCYFIFTNCSVILTKSSSQLFMKQKLNDDEFSFESSVSHLPNVDSVENLFSCGSEDICLKVRQFYVSANNTFNCKHSFLRIEFFVENKEKIKILTTGFLAAHGGYVHTQQRTSELCKKIRRYNINEKQVVISVIERIRVVEKTEVEETIESELLRQFDFLTCKMKLDRFVPIHGSSHRKCFVCCKKWSPKNRLHEVNIDSLRIINMDMKIFVKSSSRRCKKHLDFKSYLNTQEVINMSTKKEKVDRIKINLMGSSRILDEN
ncbi:unnamed protein product [Brachionus calyciflorus]|uniref:Uncharacterized protein n=1 Tax=Brachionus calyciflorus TaxID=104777 RepID=A0A814PSG2_9BILA|nr:unnamed protein product [Brachionus calyciflorus]